MVVSPWEVGVLCYYSKSYPILIGSQLNELIRLPYFIKKGREKSLIFLKKAFININLFNVYFREK